MQNQKQRRILILAALVLAAVCAIAVYRLNGVAKIQLVNRTGQTFVTGVVTEILQDNIQENGQRVGQQTVLVRMTSGEKKGQELETTSSAGYLFGAACTAGMRAAVIQSVAGDTVITTVYSQDRTGVVIGFAVLYLAVLWLVGGFQGLKGALGLVFAFVSILYIYLPVVYLGYSPFWAAVLLCAVVTVVTMALIGGLTRKSLCATVGTLAGVLIAGVAAEAFSLASGITGWNVSDIESLQTLYSVNDIQVGELLFSGLLISSLGAVMDVAMSISSSMQEICSQNPSISRLELMQAGMRVGRDMMGTDSNTLILAFAGSSISMLIMDYAYHLPFLQIMNSNNIGIAVMQGLAGSFGVVLCVPATVVLAAWIYKAEWAEKAEKTEKAEKAEKTGAAAPR